MTEMKNTTVTLMAGGGNHAMDWGPEGLLDTVELFRVEGDEVVVDTSV